MIFLASLSASSSSKLSTAALEGCTQLGSLMSVVKARTRRPAAAAKPHAIRPTGGKCMVQDMPNYGYETPEKKQRTAGRRNKRRQRKEVGSARQRYALFVLRTDRRIRDTR